jgi:hypothetical protein
LVPNPPTMPMLWSINRSIIGSRSTHNANIAIDRSPASGFDSKSNPRWAMHMVVFQDCIGVWKLR